jgi:multisubunit Na+/H+ antiporter MnhB subunit
MGGRATMKIAVTGAIVLILFAGFLYSAVCLDFGEPAYSDMDDYFIEQGQEQTGGNNIVTDVVFDFRGFDTLGEATVLFTAVLGVVLMFRKLREDEEYEYE